MNSGATVALLLALSAPPQEATPKDRIAFIAAKARMRPSMLAEAAVAGHWTRGPGLAGLELYLFPDRTYLFTEWADVIAETVMDKGHWALTDGVLTFSPDPDVTWPKRSDRRFVAVREDGGTRDLLIGLERSFDLAEKILRGGDDAAGSVLRAVALTKERDIDVASGPALGARVLKRAWRPDAYSK